jgi:hypothetical protein
MTRNEKLYRSEIQYSRSKILLTQILNSSGFLNSTGYRRPVIGGYIKFFDGSVFYAPAKVAGKSETLLYLPI